MKSRRPVKDLTGLKFGRWTVLRLHSEEERQVTSQKMTIRRWWCRCDCGVEKDVHRQLLILGKSTSCGCFQKENSHILFAIPGTARKKVIAQYKRSAKYRGLVWGLTDEQAFLLIESPCYYTGKLPSTKMAAKSGEIFLYNGIDRVDSSKGYTYENCVPCCWEINRMKNDLDKELFLNLCCTVADRSRNVISHL